MLTGEQVRLRARTAEDADVLYGLAADLDSWEERGPQPPRALTRERYDERYASAQTAGGTDQVFVIEHEGEVVGQCELFDVDPLARTAEVGIALLATARGRGLGTDALRVLVEFAFTRLNLRRVHLTTLADNAGALASYRKVGFVEEGRMRAAFFHDGAWADALLMSILEQEWPALRPAPESASR